MSELKPCPFCGGAAEIWRATPGTTRKAWIACMAGCIALTKEHETDAEAVAAWNRRAASAEESAGQPAACSPADGYAGCNLKRTGRWNSCREPGGCIALESSEQSPSAGARALSLTKELAKAPYEGKVNAAVADYVKEMLEGVIPAIMADEAEQRRLAASLRVGLAAAPAEARSEQAGEAP